MDGIRIPWELYWNYTKEENAIIRKPTIMVVKNTGLMKIGVATISIVEHEHIKLAARYSRTKYVLGSSKWSFTTPQCSSITLKK